MFVLFVTRIVVLVSVCWAFSSYGRRVKTLSKRMRSSLSSQACEWLIVADITPSLQSLDRIKQSAERVSAEVKFYTEGLLKATKSSAAFHPSSLRVECPISKAKLGDSPFLALGGWTVGNCRVSASKVRMSEQATRPLKIRTVTNFVQLRPSEEETWRTEITNAVAENKAMRKLFEDAGYEVQTTRISTNPFSEYLTTSEPAEVARQCQLLDTILTDAGAPEGAYGLLNLGPAQSEQDLDLIPAIVAISSRLFCCAQADLSNLCSQGVASEQDVRFAQAMGEAVRKVADASAGEGCFQFCMMAGMPPLTPFFPASFAEPLESKQVNSMRRCAVGLEFPELVVEVFSAADGSAQVARQLLMERCLSEFGSVQETLLAHEDADDGILKLPGLLTSLHYDGIDISVAPNPGARSLVEGFEALLPPDTKFGQSGTLALSSMLSHALHEIRDGEQIRTVGYCGLMLPPLEDTGLAKRAAEGVLGIQQLMQYSAVCGLGLDCVPVPGDVSASQLAQVYLDIASLSARLGKPLSARLFLVPGKVGGDIFNSDNPYLCDGAVFSL